MASSAREWRRLTGAGPVPAGGRDLVAYMGGRQAATRALTGMAGAPKRADYRTPEAYQAASRTWRTASRRVQRWDKENRTTAGKQLTTTERRRAQAVNREQRRRAVKRAGISVRVSGTFTVHSPGKGRDDSRTRTIPQPPGPGELIEGAIVDEVLDALREDGPDAAAAVLIDYCLDEWGMPADPDGLTVKVWPAGEVEP